ncbi:MAG: NADP-dependent oxidoreductase [Firmicutes bacterium]|nr:NADP-dependent oxidoreductase [Bacillota bacterium]
MGTRTKRIALAERPKGMPTSSTFAMNEIDLPELQEEQVLIQAMYISVDPYMRGRMNDMKSYVAPFVVGEPISGGAIGRIIESRHPKWQTGDIVMGELPWQEISITSGRGLQKLDPGRASVTSALGVLGMPGLTAYFGLLEIGKPKGGETLVVSGAAGAVGSVVGQIGKILGCRVVGIAGSADKTRWLIEELGFDAAVDYKSADFQSDLRAACPNGVDVYFDNVGGDVTDAVFRLLNDFARIPVCGQISLYNLDRMDVGPRLFSYLVIRRALAQGFIVSDYAPHFREAANQLGQWLGEGKLQFRETTIHGFDQLPEAFLGLFSGVNTGKLLVHVAD